MEFEGIITFLGKEEEVGQNGLRKLTFVLEEDTDREYKASMAIDLFNEKIDMIKEYKQGDKIKVGLNFRAREYNGRWFNSIGAWRIEKLGDGATGTAAANSAGNDDLPF
ncbi:MAG: hypothetical protein CR971_00070 [candidate division SR1 bacterium]|nr:MAG: hypothetical protein CR971_00070 [candidate division SR1 bacterium]